MCFPNTKPRWMSTQVQGKTFQDKPQHSQATAQALCFPFPYSVIKIQPSIIQNLREQLRLPGKWWLMWGFQAVAILPARTMWGNITDCVKHVDSGPTEFLSSYLPHPSWVAAALSHCLSSYSFKPQSSSFVLINFKTRLLIHFLPKWSSGNK